MIIQMPVITTLDITNTTQLTDLVDSLFIDTKKPGMWSSLAWLRWKFLHIDHDQIQKKWTRSTYIDWKNCYMRADRNKIEIYDILCDEFNIYP